jgi:hypothetical protein
MIFDATQILIDALKSESENGAVAEALTMTSQSQGSSGTADSGLSPALAKRKTLSAALAKFQGYKGIRGKVKFGPNREPLEAKAMIFNAQTKVNTREMKWLEYKYGPPF